jgi:hypothetical protein
MYVLNNLRGPVITINKNIINSFIPSFYHIITVILNKNKSGITVREAIISAIKNSPQKQANLNEIYSEVEKITGKQFTKDIIRGVINRSLTTRKKNGPYPILFVRISESTYTLADLIEKKE